MNAMGSGDARATAESISIARGMMGVPPGPRPPGTHVHIPFEIGGTVWFMLLNKIKSATVRHIQVEINDGGTKFKLSTIQTGSELHSIVSHEEAFVSKAALIESL